MTRLGRLWDVILTDREPKAALFCTYGFDATFFESEVLPALFPISLSMAREAGPANAYLNAADSTLARQQISVFYDHLLSGPELLYGCWRVDAAARAFHPKLIVLDYGDRIRVVIGSANVTRPAWSSLLELFVVEDLTPGEPHPWSEGLNQFCSHLLTRIPDGHLDSFGNFADGLSTVPFTLGHSRVCSSWDGPLLDAVLDGIEQAKRVDIVSPFFEGADGEGVLDTLRSRLGPVPGRIFTSTDDSGGQPIVYGPPGKLTELINNQKWSIHSVHKVWDGDEPGAPMRALHGKLLAVTGNGGVRLMIGSANVTRAALLHQAPDGNVELVVIADCRTVDLARALPQSTALDPGGVEFVESDDPTGEDVDGDHGPERFVLEATYRATLSRLELTLSPAAPDLTIRYKEQELRGELAADIWSVELTLGAERYVTVVEGEQSGAVPFVMVDPEAFTPRGTADTLDLDGFCEILAGHRELPIGPLEHRPDQLNSAASGRPEPILGSRGAIPWRRYLAAVSGLGRELENARGHRVATKYVIENPTRLAGLRARLDDAFELGRFTRADLAYALYEIHREIGRVLNLETPETCRELLASEQASIGERITGLVSSGGQSLSDQLAVLTSVDVS